MAQANEAPARPAPITTPEQIAAENVRVLMTNPAMVPAKFKRGDGSVDGDAMLKSYLEMERMRTGQTGPDPTSPPSQEESSEPGSLDTVIVEQAESGSGQPSDSLATALDTPEAPKGAELWASVEKELSAVGKISPATLAALKVQGVPDTMIAMAQAGREAVAKSLTEQAHSLCGGKPGYDAAINFAKSLPEADRRVLSEGLKGPNALNIIAGLAARAQAAGVQSSGHANTANAGVPSTPPGSPYKKLLPFSSPQEQTQAMMDKQYRTDPNYRAETDARAMIGSGVDADTAMKAVGLK